MIKDIVKKNRSYRRFDESIRLSAGLLKSLIDLARLSPSSRNQQALKFMMTVDPEECNLLFKSLAWAGYLPDWKGPVPGERPSAYITILGDKRLGQSFSEDLGIAAQSILLGVVDEGYGGCMVGSIKREKVRQDFKLPEHFEILLVLALGKPIEEVVIEELIDGNVRYWRDKNGIHHVPKRDLLELII